ncbi:hypothetical protein A1O3_05134 [Capronia epimyces CBS 606.96]|uniref:Uncharacterized protein n=1 Tax=Capronia epimyces CBS 606.96 TaxID=1182542 RepID=W9Y5I2_9EURO|nr:uncharacterized protein A1O3_05134 [Capronia epimyces CBS 606.96]EXJ84466.1 hypothetical protein A1O3_05134 [Capronia epimyces CBS 606.96]
MQPIEEGGQPQAEEQSIDYLCRLIRHVYLSILEGLDITGPEKGHDGEQYFPEVSAIVRLFQTILGRLHKCALDEFVTRHDEDKNRNKGRRSGTKSIAGTPHNSSPGFARQAESLTRTLVRMITDLDASNTNHCEILEGILCAFFDHAGSSLSLLIFGDSKQKHKSSTGVLPPRGLLDVAHLDLEAAMGSATLEGPYLVFILRKSIEFLHHSTKRMSEDSLLLFSVQKPDTTHPGRLRRLVEETLQNTLLRGVYGDDDDTFYNALRRDEGADEDGDDVAKMMEDIRPDEDGAEWFIGQLWEHLGWDILSGQKGL